MILMQPLFKDIIPDSIDELFEEWNKDDGDQHRLTLLHKNGDNLYCFLSRGVQEITPEKKIDLGMTIALSKYISVNCHYDVIFHKRDIEDGYYFTMDDDNPFELKSRIVPFCYQSDLPSVIVEKSLTKKLLEYIAMRSDDALKISEYIGEHNILKVIFKAVYDTFIKKPQPNEIASSFRKNISDLFHEEKSPSVLLQPKDYVEEDHGREAIFVKKKIPKKTILAMPLLAFVPYSLFIESIATKTIKKYEQKFGQSKEEEAKSLLSEFGIGHPKASKGMRKMAEWLKHTANLGVYTALAGTTALAYHFTMPAISYPLIACSGASGLTMLANLALSKGKDSSGIIASIIERKYCKANKLE